MWCHDEGLSEARPVVPGAYHSPRWGDGMVKKKPILYSALKNGD